MPSDLIYYHPPSRTRLCTPERCPAALKRDRAGPTQIEDFALQHKDFYLCQKRPNGHLST